ncbi:MAG: TetR/AcrR family transcriptional regulator [Leucobacter sp.]|nr:TetR/AcrR family transcriptional regulator [Leucobacter sp.]
MTDSPREPKQDRSRETRVRILESTVDCLAKLGWQATTTSVVAERSGISRGALQHHFPTREELVLAAITHMFEHQLDMESIDESQVTHGRDRFDYLVEQVLEYYASDLFKAALQIWTAAIAEPALRERLQPLEGKFARGIYDKAVRTLGADVTDERTHRLIQTTLDLARGLGLADVLHDDSKRRRSIAKFWAGELRSIKLVEA